MSGISTHVLDTARGRPAAGVAVSLERRGVDGEWTMVAQATTDADGRALALASAPEKAVYRLRFRTAGFSPFYPEVVVVFAVEDAGQRYHVPLLLGPFGYTTYRGS